MKYKVTLSLLTLALVSFSTAFGARAEAPVVDLSRSSQDTSTTTESLEIDQQVPITPRATPSHQNEPIDQRVLRLERQIANLNEMNYASKFEKVQQELQKLQGQIEVQNHSMTELKDQVHNFYQDLDQRLAKKPPAAESSAPEGTAVGEKEKSTATAINGNDTNKTKALQTYEAAFNLLNKKEYDKAINSFQTFIKNYPNSSYTVNAHYWLGEIYYLKDKPELANKEFQTILSEYSDSPKVADALLKIALIAMDAGNDAKARQNLIKVQKQFPGSTAAKIATLRLKELKQKR